jgi:hypothetical protein
VRSDGLQVLDQSVLIGVGQIDAEEVTLVVVAGLVDIELGPHLFRFVSARDEANTKAGAAVLYYRTGAGLEKVATKGAVASKAAGIDALVEQVLASIADGDTVRLDMDGQKVLAGRVARTGWLLVLMRWYPSLVVPPARASAR